MYCWVLEGLWIGCHHPINTKALCYMSVCLGTFYLIELLVHKHWTCGQQHIELCLNGVYLTRIFFSVCYILVFLHLAELDDISMLCLWEPFELKNWQQKHKNAKIVVSNRRWKGSSYFVWKLKRRAKGHFVQFHWGSRKERSDSKFSTPSAYLPVNMKAS